MGQNKSTELLYSIPEFRWSRTPPAEEQWGDITIRRDSEAIILKHKDGGHTRKYRTRAYKLNDKYIYLYADDKFIRVDANLCEKYTVFPAGRVADVSGDTILLTSNVGCYVCDLDMQWMWNRAIYSSRSKFCILDRSQYIEHDNNGDVFIYKQTYREGIHKYRNAKYVKVDRTRSLIYIVGSVVTTVFNFDFEEQYIILCTAIQVYEGYVFDGRAVYSTEGEKLANLRVDGWVYGHSTSHDRVIEKIKPHLRELPRALLNIIAGYCEYHL